MLISLNHRDLQINVGNLLSMVPGHVDRISGTCVTGFRGIGYEGQCEVIHWTVTRRYERVTCEGGWTAVVQWPYIVAFEKEE